MVVQWINAISAAVATAFAVMDFIKKRRSKAEPPLSSACDCPEAEVKPNR